MRVAALQFDVTTEVAVNLATVSDELRRAADQGVDLVVLPEMWASSFPRPGDSRDERVRADREAVESLRELSAQLELGVAGSALALEKGELRNRLQLFEDGTELLCYDKIHLFSPTAEDEVFGPGEEAPATVATLGARVSGGVCYDLRFPEVFRVPFRESVEVLMVPAQWPSPRATHWRALSVARAIENQCFLVAANRCGQDEIGRRKMPLEFPGNSLIVSPHGEVLAEGQGQVGLVSSDIDLGEARRFQTRVPVRKDERLDLYARWLIGGDEEE